MFAHRKNDELEPRVAKGDWVCISPERWTLCASYSDAVELLHSRGVGVLDQAYQCRHGDLCDMVKFSERCVEMERKWEVVAERRRTAYEERLRAAGGSTAAGTSAGDVGPRSKPYIVTTGCTPEMFAAWGKTSAESYFRFLKANPSYVANGF
jgi:hypothetical protein